METSNTPAAAFVGTTYQVMFSAERAALELDCQREHGVWYRTASNAGGYNGAVYATNPEDAAAEQIRRCRVFGWTGFVVVRDLETRETLIPAIRVEAGQ